MPDRSATKELRDALGAFATGVTIVTTRDAEGNDVGLTANSFNSVSLDPPMVLWSLALSSRSLPAFRQAEEFAVHILSADQEGLSSRFASRGIDKFAGLEVERNEAGIPLLPGCAARLQCRTAHQYQGGDHLIFVGEVLSFERDMRPPLVFHSGRYALTAPRAEQLSQAADDQQTDERFNEDFIGYLLGRAHYQLYAEVRALLADHELSERDHFILAALGLGEGRTREEIAGLLSYTGATIDKDALHALVERTLLRASEGRYFLTDQGRKVLKDLNAAGRGAEEAALAGLDANQIALVRSLLKHIIRSTDPGIPDEWSVSADAE